MFIIAFGSWQTGSSRPIGTAAERDRRYPKGREWCACTASETMVSRQNGFVKKGGKTLLFVEYHE